MSKGQSDLDKAQEDANWRHAVQLREFTGAAPPPLCDHSAVFDEDSKSLLLICGYCPTLSIPSNEIYEYRIDLKQWSKIVLSSATRPTPRCCHSSRNFSGQVIVFGGYDGTDQLNETWEFSMPLKKWTKILAQGDNPCKRQYHACCKIEGNRMLIHGGFNGSERLNDLYMFNVSTQTWQQIQTQGIIPAPRDSHTITPIGDSIYLFGGFATCRTNDMYVLKLSTSQWARFPPGMLGAPVVRFGHTAVSFWNKLFIFHGFDGKSESNAIFEFDPATNRWKSVEFNCEGPLEGHCYHAVAFKDTDKRVFCFGGWNGTKYSNNLWQYEFMEYFDATENVKDTKKGKK